MWTFQSPVNSGRPDENGQPSDEAIAGSKSQIIFEGWQATSQIGRNWLYNNGIT
jgi:hypothetical protein